MSKAKGKGKGGGGKQNADDIKPEEETQYFARQGYSLNMKQGKII